MNKAKWNGGAEAITFKVVMYVVLEPEVKTWWMASFVGDIRQGILVTADNGYQFLIDNQYGDGYHKVVETDGSPGASHKSVDNYQIVDEDVPLEKWITEVDHFSLKAEHELTQDYLREHHPEAYKKTQALLEHGRKMGYL